MTTPAAQSAVQVRPRRPGVAPPRPATTEAALGEVRRRLARPGYGYLRRFIEPVLEQLARGQVSPDERDRLVRRVAAMFAVSHTPDGGGLTDVKAASSRYHDELNDRVAAELTVATRGRPASELFQAVAPVARAAERDTAPLLEDGVRLTVELAPPELAAQRGALDMRLRIAPNDSDLEGEASDGEGKFRKPGAGTVARRRLGLAPQLIRHPAGSHQASDEIKALMRNDVDARAAKLHEVLSRRMGPRVGSGNADKFYRVLYLLGGANGEDGQDLARAYARSDRDLTKDLRNHFAGWKREYLLCVANDGRPSYLCQVAMALGKVTGNRADRRLALQLFEQAPPEEQVQIREEFPRAFGGMFRIGHGARRRRAARAHEADETRAGLEAVERRERKRRARWEEQERVAAEHAGQARHARHEVKAWKKTLRDIDLLREEIESGLAAPDGEAGEPDEKEREKIDPDVKDQESIGPQHPEQEQRTQYEAELRVLGVARARATGQLEAARHVHDGAQRRANKIRQNIEAQRRSSRRELRKATAAAERAALARLAAIARHRLANTVRPDVEQLAGEVMGWAIQHRQRPEWRREAARADSAFSRALLDARFLSHRDVQHLRMLVDRAVVEEEAASGEDGEREEHLREEQEHGADSASARDHHPERDGALQGPWLRRYLERRQRPIRAWWPNPGQILPDWKRLRRDLARLPENERTALLASYLEDPDDKDRLWRGEREAFDTAMVELDQDLERAGVPRKLRQQIRAFFRAPERIDLDPGSIYQRVRDRLLTLRPVSGQKLLHLIAEATPRDHELIRNDRALMRRLTEELGDDRRLPRELGHKLAGQRPHHWQQIARLLGVTRAGHELVLHDVDASPRHWSAMLELALHDRDHAAVFRAINGAHQAATRQAAMQAGPGHDFYDEELAIRGFMRAVRAGLSMEARATLRGRRADLLIDEVRIADPYRAARRALKTGAMIGVHQQFQQARYRWLNPKRARGNNADPAMIINSFEHLDDANLLDEWSNHRQLSQVSDGEAGSADPRMHPFILDIREDRQRWLDGHLNNKATRLKVLTRLRIRLLEAARRSTDDRLNNPFHLERMQGVAALEPQRLYDSHWQWSRVSNHAAARKEATASLLGLYRRADQRGDVSLAMLAELAHGRSVLSERTRVHETLCARLTTVTKVAVALVCATVTSAVVGALTHGAGLVIWIPMTAGIVLGGVSAIVNAAVTKALLGNAYNARQLVLDLVLHMIQSGGGVAAPYLHGILAGLAGLEGALDFGHQLASNTMGAVLDVGIKDLPVALIRQMVDESRQSPSAAFIRLTLDLGENVTRQLATDSFLSLLRSGFQLEAGAEAPEPRRDEHSGAGDPGHAAGDGGEAELPWIDRFLELGEARTDDFADPSGQEVLAGLLMAGRQDSAEVGGAVIEHFDERLADWLDRGRGKGESESESDGEERSDEREPGEDDEDRGHESSSDSDEDADDERSDDERSDDEGH